MTPEQIEQFNALIDDVKKLTESVDLLIKANEALKVENQSFKVKLNEIIEVING